MSKLITAWDTRTGKERRVPENWFDHEEMSSNLTRTDPKILRVPPAGVNQVTRPDDRDYATPEEIAAAKAAEGELKGKQLDEALDAAGLPKTGKVAEKQARLVDYQAEQEAAAAAKAEADRQALIDGGTGGDVPTDSINGDTNTGAPQPGEK